MVLGRLFNDPSSGLVGVLLIEKGKRRPRDVFFRRATLEQPKVNHVWILKDRNHNEYAVPPDSTYSVTLLREANCVFCHTSRPRGRLRKSPHEGRERCGRLSKGGNCRCALGGLAPPRTTSLATPLRGLETRGRSITKIKRVASISVFDTPVE